MFVRCLYILAASVVLHTACASQAHDHARLDAELESEGDGRRKIVRRAEVLMAADGALSSHSFHVTGGSAALPDARDVVQRSRVDHEQAAALLQESETLAKRSHSVFSLARTRSLFSFSSLLGADATVAGGKPKTNLFNSPLFYVLVIFLTIGCVLSSVAQAFSRTGSDIEQTGDGENAGSDHSWEEPGTSGGQALVEKELSSSPEGLDEDIYGMGIAAIIRDSQRFAMKTELFALRASRLSVSILAILFTMTLQVFLLYEMKHLVTSVSTHEARDTYDKYEVLMYGNNTTAMVTTANGYHRGVAENFNSSNFALLDDALKDSTCQMPLSQPTFFIGILLIWTLVCFSDMRRTINLGGALLLQTPTIDTMAKACVDTPETGDEAVIVSGLTVTVKAIITVAILIPRMIVSIVLLWLGCRWLCGTMGFSDVLQNTVTLEFILLLKDVFYKTMAPHHNQIETRNTLILPNASKQNPNAGAFLGAFAWGLVSILWVLLYVEHFQTVLPEYNWDIHNVCQEYLSSVESATP